MRERTGFSALASVGLRAGIAGLFAVVPRLFVDVELHGLEHDARVPRTYFAISHKRDLDSIAPLPPILWHGGWGRLARDLHFAMRADGFEPGFLSRVVRRPAWCSRALHRLNVAAVLHLIGIHPLIGFHTRPAESWLRDVLAAEGNLRTGVALAPDAIQALAAARGEPVARIEEARLSRLLTWGYTHHLPALCGPDVLTGQARRGAERRAVEATKARLAEAASWLHAGGSLYSSPEGGFSPDGRLGRITSGFHRLLRAAPVDTQIVPVAIVYDYMTTRRMRMFVDLGPAVARAPELPHGELDARLRDAWRAVARFTCTQLGAAFVVERGRSGDPIFTAAELARALAQRAEALAAAGRHVDARLLAPALRQRLGANFLAEAARRGVVRPVRSGKSGRWRATPGPLDITGDITLPPGEVGYPSAPLAYAWNEYRDLLARDTLPESTEQQAQATDAADAGDRDQLGA